MIQTWFVGAKWPWPLTQSAWPISSWRHENNKLHSWNIPDGVTGAHWSHGTFSNSSSCGKDCAQGSVGWIPWDWSRLAKGEATKTNVFHSCSSNLRNARFRPRDFSRFRRENIAEGMWRDAKIGRNQGLRLQSQGRRRFLSASTSVAPKVVPTTCIIIYIICQCVYTCQRSNSYCW